MKIYVAAKFDQKDVVRRLYQNLNQSGHSITLDWTQHKPIKPYAENPLLAQVYAEEDIAGVAQSEVFILLSSDGPNKGMYVELGAALLSNSRTGKPAIYAVGEHIDSSVFFFHPQVIRCQSIDEVMTKLGVAH